MHLLVTLQLFIDYNKEKVEQRWSPGSSQGTAPGSEVCRAVLLGDISGDTEQSRGTKGAQEDLA